MNRTPVGRWCLGLAVLSSVLAIGALDPFVLSVIVVIVAAAACLTWAAGGPLAVRTEAGLLALVAIGLTVLTAVQCLPGTGALSPHGARTWADALRPFHENGPSSVPATLDAAASRVEVLRGVAYVLTFLATLRVARKRDGAVFLERTILVTAVVLGLAAIAHQALGAREVFGLYQPKNRDVTIIAPLLNINQLSGYLCLGTLIAFGSLLSPTPMAPRAILALVVVALLTGIVWLASRGAVGSVVAGLLLATTLTIVVRSGFSRGARLLLPLFSAMAAGAMMAFGASPIAKQELGDTSISKLHMQWHALKSMAAAYPWIGCGRGAFESTFPEFRPGRYHVVWTHPENIVVQWISEWGIPVSVLAFASIAWALRPKVLLSRKNPPIGPYCALVALALHNLVDFSSEIPGVMISLVVCAGIVVATDAGESRERTWIERWSHHPRAVATACAVMTVGAIALALPARAHDLTDRRIALQKMSVDPRITNDAFFATLREEVLQHPAEPYFPYLGAARTLLYVPDGNVVAWIDRTLERAPVYPPAHLLLARWLRTRNPNQALLEYRLAAEQNGQQVGAEAESLVRSYEDALELVPEGKAGIDVLEALAQHVGLRLPATRWRIDAEILSREPDASAPRVRIARDLLLDFEDHAPWCDDCGRRVIDAARDAQAHADTCEPYLIEAKVRIGRGEAGAALDALAAASDRVSDRAACLRSLASLAIAAKDDARASEAIQKLSDASCSTEMECVENITSAAALEEQRGRRAQALLLYKRAAEQAPERDDLMELVAARAKSAGLHAFAADAYTKLSMRHPDNESYARLASEETSAARSLRP